jgi:bifunctional non-homologous end joining protein LigD
MTLWEERPIRPMFAQTGEPFDSADYLFEPKWDGLRTIMFLNHGKLELQNRNLRNVTLGFPEIQFLKRDFTAKKAIIDGEIVVLNEKGIPDFQRLQNRFGVIEPKRIDAASKIHPTTYAAFDILHLNGKDLLSAPLEQRKENLHKIINEGPHLFFTDYMEKSGTVYYREAQKLGLEGTIGKDRNSLYVPGIRSAFWIKTKGIQTVDVIVVGYTPGEGQRQSSFGSLVLAVYNKENQLEYVGNVGGGFTDDMLTTIKRRLERLASKTSVFNHAIEPPIQVTWVKPTLVVEVKYMNVTADRRLRFPRFYRLRPDKKPIECRWQ